MSNYEMNRRNFLRGSSIAMGAFFSSQTLLALADSVATPTATPTFLNKDDFLMMSQLCEIVMPRTDTPGALDVGVPNTLDTIFAQVLTPAEQSKIRDSIAAFNRLSKKIYGGIFLGLPAPKQQDYAKTLNINFVHAGERDATLIKKYGKSLTPNAVQQAIDFFATIKELTLLAFFKSEAGSTKVLHHVAIPGRFDGSVPLKDIGKTWAQT